MGRLGRTIVAGGALAALLAHGATGAQDAPSRAQEEAEGCLDCHADPGEGKRLASGEVLSLVVEPAAFRASVHAPRGCRGCHADLDPDAHPEPRHIASRADYAMRLSRACVGCHRGPQLRARSAHTLVIAGDDAPPCSECHPPHRIPRMREWRAGVPRNVYCLVCHRREIRVGLDDREILTIPADATALGTSVHLHHECPDCHATHSKQEHPLPPAVPARERARRLAEACRECHAEKYRLLEESVHARGVSVGALTSPLCTDCHGGHQVGPRATLELLSGMPCRRCHAEVFEAFRASVHGGGFAGLGHTEAPLCSGCHRVHGETGVSVRSQLSLACLSCHEDAATAGHDWLPSRERHLEVVTCPTCHVPEARRRVELRFYAGPARRRVSDAEVEERLGPGTASLLERMTEGTTSVSIWAVLRELNRRTKDADGKFTVELDVAEGAAAHAIGRGTEALRRCEACHRTTGGEEESLPAP